MRARIFCLVAATALAATTATTVVAPSAHATTPRTLFGLIDTWETQVANDETNLGFGSHHSGIVGTFLHWSTRASSGVNWANWVRARGGAPMLDLMPASSTTTLYQMSRGSDDTALKSWASALVQWGVANKTSAGPAQFLLRLFPEMNGSWESYSPNGKSGMSASSFRAAWVHIYNLFYNTTYGGYRATNVVKFIWNPNRYYGGEHYKFSDLWPGANYVNWVALDLYNWADKTHGTYWPYYLAKKPYDSLGMIRALPGGSTKPFMIAELGCAPYTYKPNWIARSISDAQALGAKAVVWYNEHPSTAPNWRLDSSSSVLYAARKAYTGSGSGNVGFVGHGVTNVGMIDTLFRTGKAPW